MVSDKEIAILNLDYQDFLTYMSINLSVAVTILFAFISYELVAWQNQEGNVRIVLFISLVAFEIIFIAIHFWLYDKKRDIKKDIERKFDFLEKSKRYIPKEIKYSKSSKLVQNDKGEI